MSAFRTEADITRTRVDLTASDFVIETLVIFMTDPFYLLDAPDLTKISPVGCCAADGVARFAADNQIKVGSIGSEWIIAGLANFLARLPPAVLTAHDAAIRDFC